jgi:hypothetical protein
MTRPGGSFPRFRELGGNDAALKDGAARIGVDHPN